jgi:hypothetical protein
MALNGNMTVDFAGIDPEKRGKQFAVARALESGDPENLA